jgi:rod shape-determining protein MreC
VKQSGAAGRLATLRLLVQRFAFLSLIVASVALMILGKADIVLIERTRALVADAIAPILDAMARPPPPSPRSTNFRELANLHRERPAEGRNAVDALADRGAAPGSREWCCTIS